MALPPVPSKVLKHFIGLDEPVPPKVLKHFIGLEEPVPSKVLKHFIGLEEPKPINIVRATPAVSKYQPQLQVEKSVTMRQPNSDRQLRTPDKNSTTMPRNQNATSNYRASVATMGSISEDSDDQNESPQLSSPRVSICSETAFRRKGAMRKSSSPCIDIDTITEHKGHHPLRRAVSAGVLLKEFAPYDPGNPLIVNYPLKDHQISRMTHARSVKSKIGPLTKEVCDQLSIKLEPDDHSTKVNRVRICLVSKLKNFIISYSSI